MSDIEIEPIGFHLVSCARLREVISTVGGIGHVVCIVAAAVWFIKSYIILATSHHINLNTRIDDRAVCACVYDTNHRAVPCAGWAVTSEERIKRAS